MASEIGEGKGYGKSRDYAASLSLVPRQHSSGDKHVLLGISKRGNSYLRTLLINGARAVVTCCGSKTDPLSRWLQALVERRGFNKAAVALANKMLEFYGQWLARIELMKPLLHSVSRVIPTGQLGRVNSDCGGK